MRKITGVLFVISVLLCGLSTFVLMMPWGVPIFIAVSESFGDKILFKVWGIAVFGPWLLAGILWYLDSSNAEEILDRFDKWLS